MQFQVIVKRHVYSSFAFIKVCSRHQSISQVNNIKEASCFNSVDDAVEFLSNRRERIDRFNFFYVSGDKIISQAFKSDYSI